jgi:hypothetical protein
MIKINVKSQKRQTFDEDGGVFRMASNRSMAKLKHA